MSGYSDAMNVILTLRSFNNAHGKFKNLNSQERLNLITSGDVIFNHKLLDDIIEHIRKSDFEIVSLSEPTVVSIPMNRHIFTSDPILPNP